jgi:hypothetical protein
VITFRHKCLLSVQQSLARVLIVLVFVLFTSCGSKSDDEPSVLKKLLCGNGLAKGILTVGLNLLPLELALGELKGQGLLSETASTDEGLKTLLNSALSNAGVSSGALNVSQVSSAFSGDSVKVLKMGGNYASGFGIVSGLLVSTLQSQDATKSLFKYVREGFKIAAATDFEMFDPNLNARFVGGPWFSHNPTALTVAGSKFNEAQWHLKQTRLEDALGIFQNTTKEVRVAVIDTGVDGNHPDLKDVVVEGYNAVDGGSDTDDKNGHGTHCAGIIAAQMKTPQSARGVAAGANVKIIPVKVLGDNGSGTSDAIDKGIRWAIEKGKADVISMSLGGGLEFNDVQKAGGLQNPILKEAIDKGVVVVVAAGNENCALGGNCEQPGFLSSTKFKEYTVVPCAQEGTICVGATDPVETLAKYSNFSSQKTSAYRTKADVNAPGTQIYSTWPVKLGSYKAISGTSMATPYVAGVAALLKANAPDGVTVNQEFVRAALQKGLVFEDSAKAKSGTGRVDLYATAYEFSKQTLSKTPSSSQPTLKPNPQNNVLPPPGSSNGGGAVGTVWELLCAL